MKREAKMMSAPPLVTAISRLLGDPPAGNIGIMGSPRTAVKLAAEGYDIFTAAITASEARSLNAKGPALGRTNGDTNEGGRLSTVHCRPEILPFLPHSLDVLFAVSILGSHKIPNISETVATWQRSVRPGGLFAIAELAGEGRVGRFMLRLARRIRGRPKNLEPADLCGLLLGAGVGEINQVWPQGIGSWMLTYGTCGSLSDIHSKSDTTQ